MEEHRRWKWRVLCLHYRAQFVYRKKTARVYAYQGLMACWNGVLGGKKIGLHRGIGRHRGRGRK